MNELKVGMIIPTMNRSQFVIRQLRYYARTKSPHPIYISDASGIEHHQALVDEIKQLSGQLAIHYAYEPSLNERLAIGGMLERVEESYCAFVGDDDFLIPESVSQCAEFLAKHPDYRVAQGDARLFTLKQSGAYGQIESVVPYWRTPQREEQDSIERLHNYARNYWVPLFATHRTHEFLADWNGNSLNPNKSFGELMPNFMTILRGKAKYLNCLYLIRQGHDQRYLVPNTIYRLIRDPSWHEGLQLLIQQVTQALIEQGYEEKAAYCAADQAFEQYFEQVLKKKQPSSHLRRWRRTVKENLPPRVLDTMKSLYQKAKKTSGIEVLEDMLRIGSPPFSSC